ncbi:MAG: type II toxin-antitoxin system toxin DNA ADP-ribosyl transferase DarT [Dehalococcoidia bacterium]
MTAVPCPVRIFRLIDLDNLSVCLSRRGLHAPNFIPPDGLIYKPIHDIEIQDERKQRCITCGPRGTFPDYVPFYFGMRSPMLLRLHSGRVKGYDEGQDHLIYIVSTVETIFAAGLSYVFSDGHGIAAYTQWYDDLDRLNEIDWDMVDAKYWADTVDDMDRQRRKQAEFLIYQFCPWKVVHEIGVINSTVQGQVLPILAKFGVSTPVRIHRSWYY